MNPIVGIGELLWDIYPDGRKVAGGAPFNFAFHCHQLGHPAVIVSRVSEDELGRELRADVRRLGLSDEYIQIDRDHPTGTVRVTLDAAGVPTYTITENVAWDYIGEEGPVAEGLVHDTEAVCFGTLALRQSTSRNTILSFVGPGPDMPSALRVLDLNLRPPFIPSERTLRECFGSCDWLKLNYEECNFLCKTGLSAERERERGPDERWFLPRVEGKLEIVTFGGNGWAITGESGTSRDHGVPARVVDTVGAGDAFTAAMVCLHLEGRALRECARFANHYAARVCEYQGATPRIDRHEVERAAFGT